MKSEFNLYEAILLCPESKKAALVCDKELDTGTYFVLSHYIKRMSYIFIVIAQHTK